MWWPTLLDSREGHPASRRTDRLALEALEDRSLPSFLAPVTSPGGGDSLAVGDFNHDGRDDVVVISAKNTVAVSLSNGDGSFQRTAKNLVAPARQTLGRVSIEDTNADGHLDVVGWGSGNKTELHCWAPDSCALLYDNYRTVWLGKGDGSFGAGKTTFLYFNYPIGHWTYNPVAAQADFNHDGILDRAVIDGSASSDSVIVMLGNGDGTYQPAESYPAGPSPKSVAVGDFDGDGWIDLVVVNSLAGGDPTFSVLRNDGNW